MGVCLNVTVCGGRMCEYVSMYVWHLFVYVCEGVERATVNVCASEGMAPC